MNTSRVSSTKLKSLLIALLLIPWVHAIPSFAADQQSPSVPSPLLFQQLAILSDFDSDNKLDQATLFSDGTRKRIHISFGKLLWSSLSFDSTVSERGGLFSGDIDHDGDIDLVWATDNGEKSVTWLGDGRGNFSIDRDRKVDFNAFLGDSRRRFEDHARAEIEQAVLQTTIAIALRVFEYHPHLSIQASLPAPRTWAASAPFSAVLKPRGPPFDLLS